MFDKNFFEKNNVNVFSYSELYDIIGKEYYKLLCDLDEKDYGYFIEKFMKKDYVKIVFTNGDPKKRLCQSNFGKSINN